MPNVAYLHALEVLEDLGLNENFMSYTLASKALSKFYKPQPTVAESPTYPTLPPESVAYDRDGNAFDESLLSTGEKLLLTEMASGIKGVKHEVGGDINGPNPSPRSIPISQCNVLMSHRHQVMLVAGTSNRYLC